MRSFTAIMPKFWAQGSGKELRGKKCGQLVALYLMSCPSGSMCGIFYLPLVTACHESGLTEEEFRVGLEEARGIVAYDFDAELVWVKNALRHQVGETLAKNDKRRTAIVRMVNQFTGHPFVDHFFQLYGETHNLEAPPKGHRRGIEGASGIEIQDRMPHRRGPDPDPFSDPASDEGEGPGEGGESAVGTTEPEQPPDAPPAPPRRDPLARHFAPPWERADVVEWHDRWRDLFGFTGAKLGPHRRDEADLVAETIDAYGLPAALVVLEQAKRDDRVNGRAAGDGERHDSIRYLLKPETFARLQRDAEQRKAKPARVPRPTTAATPSGPTLSPEAMADAAKRALAGIGRHP